ncbi:hypothetical protein PR202_gb08219 [Eleusine coracana subsp. coracana]|uniref:Uncharacterized protein n=1 Tax=Eleusine coracana subsp. coracana TaxID=191504 RepID=A0AAV5EE21_ELECO|nr:hypothetical protein PR202_gb08219 [Eleusine coracana subsp. coracana]
MPSVASTRMRSRSTSMDLSVVAAILGRRTTMCFARVPRWSRHHPDVPTVLHPGVRVREVNVRDLREPYRRGWTHRIDGGGPRRRGRLFLVFVDVPVANAAEEATQLLKETCTCCDAVTGQNANVADEDAVFDGSTNKKWRYVTNAMAGMVKKSKKARGAREEDSAPVPALAPLHAPQPPNKRRRKSKKRKTGQKDN